MGSIKFDEKKYYELKLLYDKAVEDKKEQIVYDDHLLLVSYVKYMLEYLRNELKIEEKS